MKRFKHFDKDLMAIGATLVFVVGFAFAFLAIPRQTNAIWNCDQGCQCTCPDDFRFTVPFPAATEDTDAACTNACLGDNQCPNTAVNLAALAGFRVAGTGLGCRQIVTNCERCKCTCGEDGSTPFYPGSVLGSDANDLCLNRCRNANICPEVSYRSADLGGMPDRVVSAIGDRCTEVTSRPAPSSELKTGTIGGIAGSSATLSNPLGNVTIPSLIGRIIRAMIGLVGALALLMFVYGGIRWITAGGSDENIKKAQTILKNATIGLLMIFLSYTIVSAFFNALGNQ